MPVLEPPHVGEDVGGSKAPPSQTGHQQHHPELGENPSVWYPREVWEGKRRGWKDSARIWVV